MTKLDKKDRILLYELSKNARTSHTLLGKKIHLSKSSIGHRIRKLQTLGIIEQFTAVLHYGTMGIDTSIILLRFNEHITDEILDYFRKEEHTTWAITLSGQWDILIEIAFNAVREQQTIIKKILKTFSGRINNIELVFQTKAIRVEHLVKDFYKQLNKEMLEQESRTITYVAPDATDRKILRAICENSASNILDLAKKTGKSVDTVSERLKELKENQTILKFFTEINLRKLGYIEYLYKIKLNNLDQEKIIKLTKDIKWNDHVKFACTDVTGTHLIIHFALKEAQDIDEFTSEIRKKYWDIIETQDYYLIKEQLKFDLFPKALVYNNGNL